MKKLLILMLVLGLASSANALNITFSSASGPACGHTPGGDIDVLPGALVVVDITADAAVSSAYAVSITESTTSAAGMANATAVGAYHTTFNLNVVPGILRNAMTNWPGPPHRYMLIDRATAGISPATPIAAGQVLYSFEVLIPEAAEFCDTWTITAAVGTPAIQPPPAPYGHLADAVVVAGTTALTIHAIPEPATIALLGLGSMFLMRRRRK